MEFKKKFVGFVDILGFKELVKSAENGTGMSLPELLELLNILGTSQDITHFNNGPTICPNSKFLQHDLDFRVTQISDCVIVSSEWSSAGVINLIGYCYSALIKLLLQGIMCRGYITQGNVYHNDNQIIGTAYMEALEKEKNKEIVIFQRSADEKGTPFVEIAPDVCSYISNCNDSCVKKLFKRYTATDGKYTALFPFNSLIHSFAIDKTFDPEKQKISTQNLRALIIKCKDRIDALIDKSDPRAVQKGEHYLEQLDKKLSGCDKTDEIINKLSSVFPSRRNDYGGQVNSPKVDKCCRNKGKN